MSVTDAADRNANDRPRSRLRSFFSLAKVALDLGLANIGRIIVYRYTLRFGVHPVQRLRAQPARGPFFAATSGAPAVDTPDCRFWGTEALYFGWFPVPVGSPAPDWLANPMTGIRASGNQSSWWDIPDFSATIGDIKPVWEASRFAWAVAFALQARTGDGAALARLNAWIESWCTANPPYRGPNWKCGQESSLRVINLAMAALLLDQARAPAPGLLALVRLHLQRIAPTLQYAIAQDNNHGTAEAAALFIGGSWLAAHGDPDGVRWERAGRRWLENRAARLIGRQGSFSLYSLNYHRVIVDTFCMVEVWRRHAALAPFSARLHARVLAATEWMRHMINPVNGDGPNVGPNDGSRLLHLSQSAHRDLRPSVQLSMALFSGTRAYPGDGAWNTPLAWLGVPLPQASAPPPGSYVADDGGFAILRRGQAMAMLRYPRFRFRPSQADALHLDLWLGAVNLLRDAGSYSYNTDAEWLNYFGGTASHNTVQFDGRDQMPRLSRFLLGDWLSTSWLHKLTEDAEAVRFGAGYRDGPGASHRRTASLGEAQLRVVDEVSGFARSAVLRWRVAPGQWTLEGDPAAPRLVHAGLATLTVSASVPIVRCELVQGWESRHYSEKTVLPVLEIEIAQPGTLTTEIHWTV